MPLAQAFGQGCDMTLGGILSIHRTGTLLSKRHTSTHLFVIWMREKIFLARPRFCRILLCVFTFLEELCCIPTIRCADKHTLVIGDLPFPVLIDTKFWDAIKYCSVVPTLVQDICMVPPFPADPAALVLGSVLRSFSPMMKTTSRGHAAGLETPPGPSRVWDRLPQHNPFPSFGVCSPERIPSPHMHCSSGVFLWNFRGRTKTPLSDCWCRLDCREPLAQFPGPRCSLATTALNTNTSMSVLQTWKWILFFFFSVFMSGKILSPEFVTLGYSPLDGTVTTSKRGHCWSLCWTQLKLGQDCHCHWANKPQQVRSDPDQGSGNACSKKSSWYHSSSRQSVVHFGIPALHMGCIGKMNIWQH